MLTMIRSPRAKYICRPEIYNRTLPKKRLCRYANEASKNKPCRGRQQFGWLTKEVVFDIQNEFAGRD